MKKMYVSLGLFIAVLSSCESTDDALLLTGRDSLSAETNTLEHDSIPLVTDSVENVTYARTKAGTIFNGGKFNIVYILDLDSNPAGAYQELNFKSDWNKPAWSNHNYGWGVIVKESTYNKYLMQKFIPGSWGVQGGYQWQCKFGRGYDELYFSYRIKFSSGFSNKLLHGKLPGMSGGASNTGGALPTGTDGWSARYMFHGTDIKFYLYYPEIYKIAGDAYPVAKKQYWGQGPTLSPGFTMKTNTWYTVTQRIVMNTPGKRNGLAEGYINGKLCAQQTGMRFRDISTLQIDRIYFANFFGASGVKPTTYESISFDDFVVYTYASGVSVARGNTPSAPGSSIILPDLQE